MVMTTAEGFLTEPELWYLYLETSYYILNIQNMLFFLNKVFCQTQNRAYVK